MFLITIEIGVPSVFPLKIPLRISAVSGSLLDVTEADFIPLIAAPGLLLSNACWIFAVFLLVICGTTLILAMF